MNDAENFSTWWRAIGSWFWTNVFGLVLVILYLMRDSNNRQLHGASMILLPLMGIAAVLSVLLVPVAHLVLGAVLRTPAYAWRLLAWVLALGGIFALSLLLVKVGSKLGDFWFAGLPYLPASLLANTLVYNEPLFRRNAAPAEQDASY